MAEMEFEEEEYLPPSVQFEGEPNSFMAGMLIKFGIISDEEQAVYVLGGLIVIIIIITLAIFFFSRPDKIESTIDPLDDPIFLLNR